MTFSLAIRTADDLSAAASETRQAQIIRAIDAYVEVQARFLGYNSAAACAGYKESTVAAWAEEAAAFIAWRDSVWQTAFALQSQYATVSVLPETEDIVAQLPGWPA